MTFARPHESIEPNHSSEGTVVSIRLGFVVLIASIIASAGPVAAADVSGRLFTVAGGSAGLDAPRSGRPATAVATNPDAVLGLPDGGFAYFDIDANQVMKVDPSGRTSVLAGNGRNGERGDGGPATEARLWWVGGLAVHRDGILIVDTIGGNIRLVRPDGIIVRVAGGGDQAGEGIPATRAEFSTLEDAAVAPNGDIFTAEAADRRVRRISTDGRIWAFAGTGKRGSNGDGGQAVRARLQGPTSVAVAQDGSVYIADEIYGGRGTLRRVAGDGTISTVVRPFPFARLAFGPFGLMAASGLEGGGDLVARVGGDGALTRLANRSRVSGFDGDGESPLNARLGVMDVSTAADGGLLISGLDSVRYVAPAHPQRLAVAITRPTLTSPRRLRVSLATTMPATVTVSVAGGKTEIPPLTASVPAGDTTLSLRRRLRAGSYVVRVVARGIDGQVAVDAQPVFPGGVLTVPAARGVAAGELERAQSTLRPVPPGRVGVCRRFSAKRVDCRILLRGYGCWEVASIRLHPNGLPYVLVYDTLLDGRCPFRPRPRGEEEPAAI